MHSISCASLIIRQPAVTGVAITNVSCGPAFARLLEKTYFMFSSSPTRPVAILRSRSPRTSSAKGLSSSCQVSTSASEPNGPVLSSSCARVFSNAGHTRNGFAFAGITSAHRRSPPFRLIFAKYIELVELFASTMASMWFSAISTFARSMRASRSSFVNGGTRPANEGRAAIAAGREPQRPRRARQRPEGQRPQPLPMMLEKRNASKACLLLNAV